MMITLISMLSLWSAMVCLASEGDRDARDRWGLAAMLLAMLVSLTGGV